jgi:hypothetical protein
MESLFSEVRQALLTSKDVKLPKLNIWPPLLNGQEYSNIFFPYIDSPLILGPRALLTKAIGLWSCINTAPTLASEASVSNTKGLEKSGNARTGAVIEDYFKD